MPQAKRPTTKKPAKSVVEVPEDLLGDEDWIGHVADMLLGVFNQRARLKVLMVTNDHDVHDPMPGAEPEMADDGVTIKIVDGAPIFKTYGLRFDELQASEERIAAAFPKVIDRVRELLAKRKRAQAEAT